jgi:hypothetical protein
MAFSSATQAFPSQKQVHPIIYPAASLGAAAALGGTAEFLEVETRLASLTTVPQRTWVSIGLIGVFGAVVHAIGVSGNARRLYGLPHPLSQPVDADFPDETEPSRARIAFLNASRGLGNLLEHLPLVLPTALYAVGEGEGESGRGRTVGLALTAWAFGRLLYTNGYAYGGPANRTRGFMISYVGQSVIMGTIMVGVWRELRK